MAVYLIEWSDFRDTQAVKQQHLSIHNFLASELPHVIPMGRKANIDAIVEWFNSDEPVGRVYHVDRNFYFDDPHTAFNFKVRFG